MLSKAARRRHAVRYLQKASEQIQLPWLCPALYRPPQIHVQSRPITHRLSPPSTSTSLLRSRSPRRLASAAVSPDLLQANNYLEYAPRRDVQPASSRLSYSRVLSDIPPHEPDGFLKLDDTVAEPPKRLSSNKFKEIQIRGNAQEASRC